MELSLASVFNRSMWSPWIDTHDHLVVASPLPSTSCGCLSIHLLYHPSETLSALLCCLSNSLICTLLCPYLGLQTLTSSFLLLTLSMALVQAYSHQLLYQTLYVRSGTTSFFAVHNTLTPLFTDSN